MIRLLESKNEFSEGLFMTHEKCYTVQAAQILVNFLAYCSNRNYKNSTVQAVKYMKYLEQSISQTIRFCGRLDHCSTNIFSLPLSSMDFGHVICFVKWIDRRNVRRGLKGICVVGFALFYFCPCHEKSMPQETHWSQENEKDKEQT